LRRLLALLLFLTLPLAAQSPPQTQTVHVGVLGIFHPRQLTLSADPDGALLVSAAGQQLFLQPRSACSLLRIRSSGDNLLLSCGTKEIRAQELRASGRNQQPAGLILSVPGRIQRRYEGVLELTAKNGELIPVINMDLETAVASVVLAETSPGTPLEALKAQAVVSRSYFVADAGRHAGYDFCDLTHCQFLREPPAAGTPAAVATAATRGIILTYDGKPFAAMFSRSCGGRTRTPQEIGLPQAGYPYFSVLCDSCYQNPFRWTRNISSEDAAQLFLHGENARLAIGRKLGWNAVPSNNFTAREQGGEVILHGVGQGHGIGLCQRGARFMAEHGASFRDILAHYFPNTNPQALPPAH
jgi:stage II sporulation protein D (peptidoglycan lytic transglycosylase)